MFNRKLITTLALLAATAGISTFAATANAAIVETDDFTLDSDHVDLVDAQVAFHWTADGVTPKVTGTLVATDAVGTRVRVRIKSYTKDGVELNTEYGNAMDVELDPDDWFVNRPGIADPLTDQVDVAVEQETLFDGWVVQDEINIDMQTTDDWFKILRQGVDVGGSGWAGGAPVFNSQVDWSIDDGEATVEFSDLRLHFDNALGSCGRIKVNYLADDGTVLDSAESNDHCPANNNHQSWAADPDIPPYTSSLLAQVEVIAQTRPGVAGPWGRAGAKTISIAEDA
jgi:hypothetical protein